MLGFSGIPNSAGVGLAGACPSGITVVDAVGVGAEGVTGSITAGATAAAGVSAAEGLVCVVTGPGACASCPNTGPFPSGLPTSPCCPHCGSFNCLSRPIGPVCSTVVDSTSIGGS